MDQFKKDLQEKNSSDLNLLRMIESRIVEIVQIENEVKKKYPKLYTQRLPRYMRRRAASHNPHRIPKWLGLSTSSISKISSKDRKRLFIYRHKIRLRKHKRILKRHADHKFKSPDKSMLHKWFAKRFKMITKSRNNLDFVPLHNNTKNFRNLFRQMHYGCAYLSMAHLVAIRLDCPYSTDTIAALNQLTRSIAGFTFAARSLEKGRYELLIHLYSRDKSPEPNYTHLCPAFVSNNSGKCFTLWVPRDKRDDVVGLLKSNELPFVVQESRNILRIRLVGPEARNEAMRLAVDVKKHQEAIMDVDRRLPATREFGISIGRRINEEHAQFTYYQTKPLAVDIVFVRRKNGRQMWNKLVRNKAHLVGGMRDIDVLLKDKKCFSLKPDF